MIEPRSCTKELRPLPYPAPPDGYLRMDANTNLYGDNPAVEEALREGAARGLNHYPSGHAELLRAAVAKQFELTRDEVIIGDGSDEILDTITKAFLNPDDVVAVPTPSFVMYGFYGRINFGRVAEVPLRVGFELNGDAILRTRAKIIFLASPNNPTGNRFDREMIEEVIKRAEGIVVVDEAYADFCGQEFANRVREFQNVIVTRTLSKSHGLAGVRIGFGLGPRDLIERLYAVKTPFTVGGLAERMGLAGLANHTYVEESVRMVAAEKPWLMDELRNLGLRPYPSDANFLLVDVMKPASPLVAKLREHKILVRDMSDMHGLEKCFRVTIGRHEHNVALVDALRDVLKS